VGPFLRPAGASGITMTQFHGLRFASPVATHLRPFGAESVPTPPPTLRAASALFFVPACLTSGGACVPVSSQIVPTLRALPPPPADTPPHGTDAGEQTEPDAAVEERVDEETRMDRPQGNRIPVVLLLRYHEAERARCYQRSIAPFS